MVLATVNRDLPENGQPKLLQRNRTSGLDVEKVPRSQLEAELFS